MSPNSSANPEDSETATFINGGDVPTVKVVSEADAADSSEAGSAQDPKKCCKCCCSFCTLKCSAISAACVLALLAIVIGAGYYRYASKLTGKASSADSEEWEAKLGGDRAGAEEVPLRELSGM